MTNVGFQVAPRARRISPELVARSVGTPVATVSDSMNRLTAGGAALRPRHNGAYLAGPALTVRTRPGDNLMVHYALDIAEPGDVIVVDAGGDVTNAILGELMVIYAAARGLGGLVVNGAIRDSGQVRVQSFPVYSTGVTHRGPYKDGPGEINVPVSIDGMVIEPGDLIIGDDDGVLSVPYHHADRIITAAQRKAESELVIAEQFRTLTADRSSIRRRVIELGASLLEE